MRVPLNEGEKGKLSADPLAEAACYRAALIVMGPDPERPERKARLEEGFFHAAMLGRVREDRRGLTRRGSDARSA